jgi:hypothetical protein
MVGNVSSVAWQIATAGRKTRARQLGVPQYAAALVGEHQIVAALTNHQNGQFVAECGWKRHRPPFPRLRSAPDQSTGTQ